MMNEDIDDKKLVHSWIIAHKSEFDSVQFNKHSWANDVLIDMSVSDPEKLLKIIFDILELDSSEIILKSVGAGPLEDLLAFYGEKYIDLIKVNSQRSIGFKRSLSYIWLDENEAFLKDRIHEIIKH